MCGVRRSMMVKCEMTKELRVRPTSDNKYNNETTRWRGRGNHTRSRIAKRDFNLKRCVIVQCIIFTLSIEGNFMYFRVSLASPSIAPLPGTLWHKSLIAALLSHIHFIARDRRDDFGNTTTRASIPQNISQPFAEAHLTFKWGFCCCCCWWWQGKFSQSTADSVNQKEVNTSGFETWKLFQRDSEISMSNFPWKIKSCSILNWRCIEILWVEKIKKSLDALRIDVKIFSSSFLFLFLGNFISPQVRALLLSALCKNKTWPFRRVCPIWANIYAAFQASTIASDWSSSAD